MEERRKDESAVLTANFESLKEFMTFRFDAQDRSNEMLFRKMELLEAEQKKRDQEQASCSDEINAKYEARFKSIESDVKDLKDKPAKDALDRQSQTGKTIRTVVLTAIVMAVIGFVGFQVLEYTDSLKYSRTVQSLKQ